MKVLAIIPARGGSKGIKNKNIRLVNRQPLIVHTINFLKNSRLFDRIIVSTDNPAIARIAQSQNIQIPFMRPKRLSGDLVSTVDVIKHVLSFLENEENYKPDVIMIFQPTSPIRPTRLIIEALKRLSTNNATSVVTVSKVKLHPNSSFRIRNKKLVPFNKNFQKFSIRQKVEPLYHPNGSLYAFWRNTLVDYDSIYGPRISPIVINEPEYNIDIDEPYDLFVTEMTLRYWKKYKNRLTN
ncbi:cytidylyltransferase domain-containing protein [Candidatus Nitrosotenuis chungbukensis]|uniref:acylneuraminate cytidylyltransferase family protein n=1 Tax=Candidatus Nitrosotenuis chungbukensis TaxID=1353246 RepID=UPI0009781E92|nr:acylneuraminate cytidylyltransferase family protein [Candidatus Nitrosotenuis chungbukensis]